MYIIRFILMNLGPYRAVFFLVAFVSILNGLADFLIPVTLSNFANDPLREGAVTFVIFSIVGLYVFSLGASYIVRRYGEALAYKYANYIRLMYFRRLASLPVPKLRMAHSGYIHSLVNKVADGMSNALFSLFWSLFPGMLLVVLFFVFIARESLLLAVFNLLLMIVFVVVSGILSRKMVPIAAERNRRNARVMGVFADFMANITTVIQLGVQRYSGKKLQTQTTHADESTDHLQRFHAGRWSLLHALFGAAFLLTICFLVAQITAGTASVGLLILFVSAYAMLRNLVEILSENIKEFMELRAYIEELEGLLEKGADTFNAKSYKQWKYIEFKNVTFRYEDSSLKIMVPTFAVGRGQKICIEGKSGQGKSTFLALLMNAFPPIEGQRFIDEDEYSKRERAFFSSEFAMISQDTELFHLSVRDNLTLGRHIGDDRLLEYINELDLRDWFNGLTRGFDTIIGEKGTTLSAGQRQRMNILRGILLERSLYIFDEPTSHLDEVTERKVVAFLERQLRGKTAIIVTHRPALEQICDSKYEMRSHTLTKEI